MPKKRSHSPPNLIYYGGYPISIFSYQFEKKRKFSSKFSGKHCNFALEELKKNLNVFIFYIFIMAVINVKLSKKYTNNDGEYPIVYCLSHKSRTCDITSGFFCFEKYFLKGNNDKYVSYHKKDSKEINQEITQTLLNLKDKLKGLGTNVDSMNAPEIKKYLISDEVKKSKGMKFMDYARSIIGYYEFNTRASLEQTLKLLVDFFNGKDFYFDDITSGVLRNLEYAWKQQSKSINTRGIHFRNLRLIFNRAIADEVTEKYPFKSFKIKSVRKAKKEFPLESFNKLKNLTFTENEVLKEQTRDVFLLSFYLCGANLNDIYYWTSENLKKNKIIFVRNKIKRFEPEKVEITLQPEALDLLNKYKGKKHLFSFADNYKNYKTFKDNVAKRIRSFRQLVDFDDLTMYYARYSWATYADKIGVDRSVIGKSLGHQEQSVAGRFYIVYEWAKTDIANRQVIDYTLGKHRA